MAVNGTAGAASEGGEAGVYAGATGAASGGGEARLCLWLSWENRKIRCLKGRERLRGDYV